MDDGRRFVYLDQPLVFGTFVVNDVAYAHEMSVDTND